MVAVWLWVWPCVAEFTALFVFILTLNYCIPKGVSNADASRILLTLIAVAITVWVSALRQRLDPFGGRVLAGLAFVISATISIVAASVSNRGVTLIGVWPEHLLRAIEFQWYIVVGGFLLSAMHRGIRHRHQSVPALAKQLENGGKTARRRAILFLGGIIATDIVSNRKDTGSWCGRLRQWVAKSDTPEGMPTAISTVESALRDDDLFVRTQAAKVFTKFGVTFVVDDLGEKRGEVQL